MIHPERRVAWGAGAIDSGGPLGQARCEMTNRSDQLRDPRASAAAAAAAVYYYGTARAGPI